MLVEGSSKRSSTELSGRCDSQRKVVFPEIPIPDQYQAEYDSDKQHSVIRDDNKSHNTNGNVSRQLVLPRVGDFVAVRITSATSLTAVGIPLAISNIQQFHIEQQKVSKSKQKQRKQQETIQNKNDTYKEQDSSNETQQQQEQIQQTL